MLLHIILFILFLFFVILIIGFSVLFKFLRMLGIGKKKGNGYYKNNDVEKDSIKEDVSKEAVNRGTAKKKIFDKTEGEYIDFEDV